AMGAILAASPSPGLVGVARINWSSFFAAQPKVPCFLENFQHHKKSTGVKMGSGGVPKDLVNSTIINVLCDVLGDPDLSDFSVPLMDMGLDSLSAVEFRNRVQASFDGLHLASTVMFDYPTVADLTDYIVAQFSDGDEADDAAIGVRDLNANEPMATIGMAARYWAMLCAGLDMISTVPIERWDIDLYHDPDPSVPGKMPHGSVRYTRWGGFIFGLEGFDNKMFGIAEPEAQAMDPHQRLEVVYESFWNAGLDKEQLSNTNCGCYVGCATLGGISVQDFPDAAQKSGQQSKRLSSLVRVEISVNMSLFDEDIGPFTNIGSFPSGSTLVALDCAAQGKRLGKCDRSIVAGSNLQLCPNTWVGFCKMGMALSPDGRCKTFDESANGFTRTDGAGSLILELASSASKAGKQEVATALGVCVNQEASVKALEVSLVEVHGTGTSLGDPIEVGGMKSTLGKGRTEDAPLVLAATKSIIGHTEGSAGVAGLIKMIGEFSYRIVPKNLHLKKMNPNIDLTDFPVIMPSSIVDWKGSRAVAGTSSFGFSGTNSHGTLEAPGGGDGKDVVLERPEKLKWNRTYHRMYHDWSQGLWFATEWRSAPLPAGRSGAGPCLVIGGGAFGDELKKLMETSSVAAKADELEAKIQGNTWKTVVFAETLVAEDPTAEGPAMAALLSAAQAAAMSPSMRFVVLTAGAQEAEASGDFMGRGLLGAAALGFMRSMPLEAPKLQAQVIDLTGPQLPPFFFPRPCSYSSSLTSWVQSIADELSCEDLEREVSYGDDSA
ncbi:pikAII, partial [Symbiodinium sp. KB8]